MRLCPKDFDSVFRRQGRLRFQGSNKLACFESGVETQVALFSFTAVSMGANDYSGHVALTAFTFTVVAVWKQKKNLFLENSLNTCLKRGGGLDERPGDWSSHGWQPPIEPHYEFSRLRYLMNSRRLSSTVHTLSKCRLSLTWFIGSSEPPRRWTPSLPCVRIPSAGAAGREGTGGISARCTALS